VTRDPIEQALARRPTHAGPWRSHHLAQHEPAAVRPEPRALDIEQLRQRIYQAGARASGMRNATDHDAESEE
jgi:hypothetical protein